jgi:hypothetical protein
MMMMMVTTSTIVHMVVVEYHIFVGVDCGVLVVVVITASIHFYMQNFLKIVRFYYIVANGWCMINVCVYVCSMSPPIE